MITFRFSEATEVDHFSLHPPTSSLTVSHIQSRSSPNYQHLWNTYFCQLWPVFGAIDVHFNIGSCNKNTYLFLQSTMLGLYVHVNQRHKAAVCKCSLPILTTPDGIDCVDWYDFLSIVFVWWRSLYTQLELGWALIFLLSCSPVVLPFQLQLWINEVTTTSIQSCVGVLIMQNIAANDETERQNWIFLCIFINIIKF